MRLLLSGMAAAFTFLFFSAPTAAAETVECPLSQARREITTDLPSGWWTTPIVDNLSETRVQNIGGEPALICTYGHAGSVQRNAPANHDCVARTGGFDCTRRMVLIPLPIPRPIPAVHDTGSISVPQTYVFDLDTGAVGSGGDIWFEAVTASELYLAPRGGAQIAVGDGSNRSFPGCSSESYSPARVSLADVPVGSYVCVRTNEGRISQFRMNAISAGSPKTLSIGFTTWR